MQANDKEIGVVKMIAPSVKIGKTEVLQRHISSNGL